MGTSKFYKLIPIYVSMYLTGVPGITICLFPFTMLLDNKSRFDEGSTISNGGCPLEISQKIIPRLKISELLFLPTVLKISKYWGSKY